MTTDPNRYILEKDAEWVQRWEEREQKFRKDVEKNREEYDKRITVARAYIKKMDRRLHDQQAVLLKIRDDLPIIGKWILKWAGYKD